MTLLTATPGAAGVTPEILERRLKRAFYMACAALAAWLLWRATHPTRAFEVDWVNKEMGRWSLRFLIPCLLLSPLSRWLREPGLRRWRRPLGLMAFAFAALHTVHFLLYGRVWPDRMAVLVQRPYLLIGTIALLLFVPLAMTSNDAMVRRVTPRRWRWLHLIAYPIAALSVAHEVMAYAHLRGEAGVVCVLAAFALVARIVRQGKLGPARRLR